MTEKRFQWVSIKDNELEFQDNGIVKRFENHRLEEFLNELHEENIQLKNKLNFFNELYKPYGSIMEENMRLKAFIKELSNNCGEIILMNGMGYNVDKILGDLK